MKREHIRLDGHAIVPIGKTQEIADKLGLDTRRAAIKLASIMPPQGLWIDLKQTADRRLWSRAGGQQFDDQAALLIRLMRQATAFVGAFSMTQGKNYLSRFYPGGKNSANSARAAPPVRRLGKFSPAP